MSRVLQVESTSVVLGARPEKIPLWTSEGVSQLGFPTLGHSRPSYVWSPELSDQRGKLLPSRLATEEDR
jgi:hypothetical protein